MARCSRAVWWALAMLAQVPAGVAQEADSVPSLMIRAAALLEQGRTDDAERLFEDIVARRPGHGPAHLELGRIALERGASEEAISHLEEAVDAPLRRAFVAWHLLGRARLQAGRAADAESAFDQALRRAERFAPALVGRAGAALALGRPEAAESDLRRALELGGAQGLAGPLLAAVLDGAGRQAEAGALLAASGAPESVLQGFRRLADWLPAERRVMALAARWAEEMGAFEVAECLARRAVDPAEPDARLLETTARAQLAGGRAEEAAMMLRRAIDKGREGSQIWFLLGRAEIARMRMEEAVAVFRRALELEEGLVDQVPTTVLTALAEVLGDNARKPLAAHLDAHPECTAGLYLLGLIAGRDDDPAAAAAYFERLATLEETAGARYHLAGLYRRLGDDERSREAMKRFRELEHQEEIEWLRRNGAFRRRLEAEARTGSEPLEALRIYRSLAAEDLAAADDYVAAGRILSEQGLRGDAREWFEKVLERQPFRRDALEGLAKTFEGAPASDDSRQVRERLELLSWACTFPDS